MKKGKKEEEEGIYALGCSVFSFQICEVGWRSSTRGGFSQIWLHIGENFRFHAIVWQHTTTYCLNMVTTGNK
jgi:hypothetical protein